MKKIIGFFCCFILANSCTRLPRKAEIEFRSRLENAIVKTFPNKVEVVIHDFENRNSADTENTYLEQALPDSLEAVLEPLQQTLSYVPFEGMPFYVSSTISNLFQVQSNINTNTNTNTNTNFQDSYFSYLTNYLHIVPVEVTQVEYDITTNTNYYNILTNTYFAGGDSKTNYTSNQILLTTTNSEKTNVVIEERNLLTSTNMLLMIHEEFPELKNYLSYLPIEVRRANAQDKQQWEDIRFPARARARKRKEQAEQAKAAAERAAQLKAEGKTPPTPTEDNSIKEPTAFTYTYHIYGNFRTIKRTRLDALEVEMKVYISLPYSSGEEWWTNNFKTSPPVLSNILKEISSINPNDKDSFKALLLRTPYKKPKVSKRLQDEFEAASTNFSYETPEIPAAPIPKRTHPLELKGRVREDQIGTQILDWQKYFHAIIINRPYTVLNIKTIPENVLVYMNGFYIGKAPLIYPTAPLGKQRIAFLKDGFAKEEIVIDIVPEQTNSISFDLSSLNNTGSIEVTSSINDAEVYINSSYRGKTPLTVSNLSLDTKYRVEVLDPKGNISSNRNSVYKQITLTEEKPHVAFDAQFKTYETRYKKPSQKALLVGTYISWLTTLSIFGVSIYTQARANELKALAQTTSTGNLQNDYIRQATTYTVASQATLYTAIGGLFISSGIMGWYLYSKEIFLGLDIEHYPQEWYANFKLKFN